MAKTKGAAERGLGGEAFCGKGCTHVADKHVLEIRIPERLKQKSRELGQRGREELLLQLGSN